MDTNNNIDIYDLDEDTLMVNNNEINYYKLKDEYDSLSFVNENDKKKYNKEIDNLKENNNNLKQMNYNLHKKYNILYNNFNNHKKTIRRNK